MNKKRKGTIELHVAWRNGDLPSEERVLKRWRVRKAEFTAHKGLSSEHTSFLSKNN